MVEFVDSRHTPRNALIRASRTDRPVPDEEALAAEHAELAAAWHVRPALAERLAAAGAAAG